MDGAGKLVAVCRCGREKLRVPVIDLPLPEPRPNWGMDRCLLAMGSMEIIDARGHELAQLRALLFWNFCDKESVTKM